MDQIAFSSLLLGLLVGVQPVRVEIPSTIHPAAVVYALDGIAVARVETPPWEAEVDFGSELRPREISASAIGVDGEVLARARRVVNLPSPAASLEILIGRNAMGAPATARLVATSVRGDKPVRTTLTLDSLSLPLDGSGSASLPALDLAKTHLLSGLAEFSQDAVARADVALGGGVTEESGSRLTAVAVRVEPGTDLTVESAARLFRHGSETLRPVAVEKGTATVLIVRFPSNAGTYSRLAREHPGPGVGLDAEDRVGLVWPLSQESRVGSHSIQIIESTPYFTSKDNPFFWILTRASRPKPSTPPYCWADAVAVAGLEAYRAGTRRATVLVGGYHPDTSRLTPTQVRGYLDVLAVPLHVWAPAEQGRNRWTENPGDLSDFMAYQRRMTALKKDLDSQRIVWIAGSWLPGQIELAPEAKGISLLR